MDYRGATVIADYGHNPDAMRALAAVEAMPGQARSVVISAAGDRRDEGHPAGRRILGESSPSTACCCSGCRVTCRAATRTRRSSPALPRQGLEAPRQARSGDPGDASLSPSTAD